MKAQSEDQEKSKRAKQHDSNLKLAAVIGVTIDAPEPDVLAACSCMKRGKDGDHRFVPVNTALNVYRILTMDTRWRGAIRTNEFDGTVYVRMPGDDVNRPVSGSVSTMVVQWLERVYEMRTNEDRVGKAINVVGDEFGFHPVRSRLRSLRWDGVARLDGLLAAYFGASDTPLNQAMGRCWMLSAVARIMRPGCKVDTMLILIGRQGARKSTACRVLALDDGWYSDTHLDLRSKDLYESIHGAWIYEIAEVDSFKNADWPRVKAVVSSATDRYRRPYGVGAETRHRQVVFVGTTNEGRIFGDVTGSRRFWPCEVTKTNIKGLLRDREQLWAEAVTRYDSGEQWWLTDAMDAELAETSEKHQHRHPWHETVQQWTHANPAGFTIADVLGGALRKTVDQWTRSDEMNVGDILRELGFERQRRRDGNQRIYVFVKPAGPT